MRFWPISRSDEESHQRHGRTDALVRELTGHFSRDAAAELQRRGWSPTNVDERIAWYIAAEHYEALPSLGDRIVPLLKRSAFVHRWHARAVQALIQLGTPAARECLAEVVLQCWRNGIWHEGCVMALQDPHVLGGLVDELCETFDPRLAQALLNAGWMPASLEERAALSIAFCDAHGAAACGSDAIPVLIRALKVVPDKQSILEALADTQTPEGAYAVLESLAEQWARGVSRWTDSELVARCGGAAVGPLLYRLHGDPAHAVLLAEMLATVFGNPERISEEDLRKVAASPDPVHLYQLPDDARTYQGTIDLSAIREAAVAELRRRGLA